MVYADSSLGAAVRRGSQMNSSMSSSDMMRKRSSIFSSTTSRSPRATVKKIRPADGGLEIIPEKTVNKSKNFAIDFNVRSADDTESSDEEMFINARKMSFFNKDKNNVGCYVFGCPD